MSLQTGVAPVQSTLSVLVHWTHLPRSGEPAAVMQAGAVSDEHALGVPEPRLPSHATHLPAEQIGVAPEHAASVRQATHVFVVVLHVGVAPPHCVLSRHWTQLIDTRLHFGVRPEQFASLEQPAVQVLVARLQMPSAPVQSPFAMH